MASDEYIPISQWFKRLTGDQEVIWRETLINPWRVDPDHPDDPIPKIGHPYVVLRNQVTKETFKCGRFQCVTLGDLRDYVENLHLLEKKQQEGTVETSPDVPVTESAVSSEDSSSTPKKTTNVPEEPAKRRKCRFEIIVRGNESNSSKGVDVAFLQSLKCNRNAVFQVASNFNAIEGISEGQSPELSNFTEKYYSDKTQGPAASISAGAAAISRVHCAFYKNVLPSSHKKVTTEEDFQEWRQRDNRQINFLVRLPDHFPVINGYVCLPPIKGVLREWPSDYRKVDDLKRRVLVAYQQDCQVTSGISMMGQIQLLKSKKQLIDQVFCAALNLGQGMNGITNSQAPFIAEKCQFLLEVAYEGTLLSAICKRRSHVFLTLIGGGVFQNPKQLIYKAILDAYLKWANHPNSSLETISLVVFHEEELLKSFIPELKQNKIPVSRVTYHTGHPVILQSG